MPYGRRNGGCDHGCVDGVATISQRVDGSLRREHVDGRRRASRSDRGRWAVQARIRQSAYVGGECRHPDDEQDGERTKRTAHDSPLWAPHAQVALRRDDRAESVPLQLEGPPRAGGRGPGARQHRFRQPQEAEN